MFAYLFNLLTVFTGDTERVLLLFTALIIYRFTKNLLPFPQFYRNCFQLVWFIALNFLILFLVLFLAVHASYGALSFAFWLLNTVCSLLHRICSLLKMIISALQNLLSHADLRILARLAVLVFLITTVESYPGERLIIEMWLANSLHRAARRQEEEAVRGENMGRDMDANGDDDMDWEGMDDDEDKGSENSGPSMGMRYGPLDDLDQVE